MGAAPRIACLRLPPFWSWHCIKPFLNKFRSVLQRFANRAHPRPHRAAHATVRSLDAASPPASVAAVTDGVERTTASTRQRARNHAASRNKFCRGAVGRNIIIPRLNAYDKTNPKDPARNREHHHSAI